MRICIPLPRTPKNFTLAVRETGISRYDGGPIESPSYHSAGMFDGVSGAPSITPRDARLSNSSTLDRCRFSSLALPDILNIGSSNLSILLFVSSNNLLLFVCALFIFFYLLGVFSKNRYLFNVTKRFLPSIFLILAVQICLYGHLYLRTIVCFRIFFTLIVLLLYNGFSRSSILSFHSI